MPKEKPQKSPVKLVYEGRDIYLTGSEESKNEIVVFSHTFMDGSTETIGLRLDTHYKVGGVDVNGKLIKDWVYDRFTTSDLNNNRVKSETEKRADSHSAEGEQTLDISL